MFLSNRDKVQIRNWLKALRSGQYSQVKKVLQNDQGYCCLGVACAVITPKVLQGRNGYGHLIGWIPSHQNASPAWLKNINTETNERIKTRLTDLNDIYFFTFKQIADVIEATFLMEPDHKALLKYMDAYNDK